MQVVLGGRYGPWKVCVLYYIEYPGRFAGGPNMARQSLALPEPAAPTGRLEVRNRLPRPMPAFLADKSLGLRIDGPEEPKVPTQAFANGAQNSCRCCRNARGLSQNLSDGEPGVAALFCPCPLADVPQVRREHRRAVRGNAGDG